MGCENMWPFKSEEKRNRRYVEKEEEARLKVLYNWNWAVKQTEEKALEERVKKKISKWELFPGSLAEYNLYRGEEHCFVNLEHSPIVTLCKFHFHRYYQFMDELLSKGCVGLVRYVEKSYDPWGEIGYGIPVKRKELSKVDSSLDSSFDTNPLIEP